MSTSQTTLYCFISGTLRENFFFSRGQFAVVRKCVEQKTGAEYAAKIMRKRRVARGVAAADIGIFLFQFKQKVSSANLFIYVIINFSS